MAAVAVFLASLAVAPLGLLRSTTRSSTRRCTSATATRSRTARCPTGTSPSSTRQGRCPAFSFPRSRTRDFGFYNRAFEVADGALRRRRSARDDRCRSRSLGASVRRAAAALAFAALAPLVLGSVMLYALRPLAGGAHRRRRSPRSSPAASASGSPRSGSRRGEGLPGRARSRSRSSGCGDAGPARGARSASASPPPSSRSCFVPFLALAPAGLWDSVAHQTTRPLQIESLGVGGAARRAPGRRALDHDGVEPRLAEPGRLAAGRAGNGLDRSAGRGAARHLARGSRAGRRRRAARALLRRRGRRLRRASARCSRRSS